MTQRDATQVNVTDEDETTSTGTKYNGRENRESIGQSERDQNSGRCSLGPPHLKESNGIVVAVLYPERTANRERACARCWQPIRRGEMQTACGASSEDGVAWPSPRLRGPA